MTEDSVLDPAGVQALRDLAGPDMPDIAEEVVRLYITTTSDAYELMSKASSAADIKVVRDQAHKIKGSAGNVGARIVGDHAFAIEMAASKGEPASDAVETLGAALEASFVALRAEFGL